YKINSTLSYPYPPWSVFHPCQASALCTWPHAVTLPRPRQCCWTEARRQAIKILRSYHSAGNLGNVDFRPGSEAASDQISVVGTIKRHVKYFAFAVEAARRNPSSVINFSVDATGGVIIPITSAPSGCARVHLNVMTMSGWAAADPTLPMQQRSHGLEAFWQLTNDLSARGFSAALASFDAECLLLLGGPMPVPPRISADFDLTLIKPLLRMFYPGVVTYAAYLQDVWAQSIRGYEQQLAHDEWRRAGSRPEEVVPSPFPGCNVHPRTGEVTPLLFEGKCLLTLCNYHLFKDVREWFSTNTFMRKLSKRAKATWLYLLMLMESVLLNCKALAGIQQLPLLLHLLQLFEELLELPSVLAVPSTHLHGHFRIRVATEEERSGKAVTAVAEFTCGPISFRILHFDRHRTNPSAPPPPCK
ncbi:hypothetical protein B484DRAFT_473646, partial [Ochromonadaceae sp. CCMP2298]